MSCGIYGIKVALNHKTPIKAQHVQQHLVAKYSSWIWRLANYLPYVEESQDETVKNLVEAVNVFNQLNKFYSQVVNDTTMLQEDYTKLKEGIVVVGLVKPKLSWMKSTLEC